MMGELSKHDATSGTWSRSIDLFGGAIKIEIDGETRDGVDTFKRERLTAVAAGNPFQRLTFDEALECLLEIVAERRPALVQHFRETYKRMQPGYREYVTVWRNVNEDRGYDEGPL